MKEGIEIVLKNGDVHSYKPQDYSEYLIVRNLFVITCQTGAWLAAYNLDEIRYFRLTRDVTAGTKMDRLPVQKMNTLSTQEGLHLHQNAESLYF